MENGDERTFHRMQNYLMADQEFLSQGDLVPVRSLWSLLFLQVCRGATPDLEP